MFEYENIETTGRVDDTRRRFLRATGGGILLAGLGTATAHAAGATSDAKVAGEAHGTQQKDFLGATIKADTVAAQPALIPAPIDRNHSMVHHIELVAKEVEAEIEPRVRFSFMTWNGQVPGPMIRVRQGDTVDLTVSSDKTSQQPHNVDFHAVYGTGGGAAGTTVMPGQSRQIRFKCVYPGAFIYHCAVANMDEHISRGMFGMILVEPDEGLPKVDREFYLGQHEVYTRPLAGVTGHLDFNFDSLQREQPAYVLFNGSALGLTPGRLGAMKAKVGETVRVFMVNGGPNLSSSFHPIGNVWSRCWPQGALLNPPLKFVQTQPVPPGSCFVGELELPVPETVKLVDHALSRVVRKGLLAEIEVEGPANPDIFQG